MNQRTLTARRFVAFLLLGTFSLIGCGGDKSEEGARQDTGAQATSGTTTTESSAPATTTSASGAEAEYVAIQRGITETIEGIHSEADVKAAEPKLDKLYSDMIALLRANVENPELMNNMPASAEIKDLTDRQSAYLQKLGQENPQAAIAVGMVIAKHAKELMELAASAMKQADPALKNAMEEAKKKIEESQGK